MNINIIICGVHNIADFGEYMVYSVPQFHTFSTILSPPISAHMRSKSVLTE